MATNRLFIIGSVETIAASTVRMTLLGDTTGMRKAGQFVMIRLEDKYLRRPISICDCEEGRLTLIVKIAGEGTAELAAMVPGRSLEILCGLGNGFDIDACKEQALIIGGGVGVAPMLLLCKQLSEAGKQVTAVIGFNTKDEIFLENELNEAGADVLVATADGSDGLKGFVTDAIRMCRLKSDYFYACGPKPMLKAVCDLFTTRPGELSMEERMGCGVGICYVCTCKTTEGPKRTCKEGPVFKKEEIVW